MNKLLLIDGHNLLFKAFYGLPERLLPDRRPIQGIIGFIVILQKIFKITNPTHALVVFDPDEEPSRTAIYDGYKQNRRDFSGVPDRENPFSQLTHVKKALDYLNIKYIEEAGHEADDMIASLASCFNDNVLIVSTDTDFLQLVDERITVLCYNGKKSVLYDNITVQERFGVCSGDFLNYKALVGDKTDNITGVRGIGPKTAVKVINGERELTTEEREIFQKNREVIALNTEITPPCSFQELTLKFDSDVLKLGELLKKLGIS